MGGDGMELNTACNLLRGLTGDGASEEEGWRPERSDSVWVMYFACQELSGHAHKVVDQAFKRLNILDHERRIDYLEQFEKSIIDIRLKDRSEYQAVEFDQYKVEGDKLQKHYADQAIRYAVAAFEEFNENIKVSLVYPDESFMKQSRKSFSLMINWLIEAQRHLAALDILRNVRKKMYANRAAKGGHSRSRPASEKDQRTLLKVMIKGLLYGDPGAPSRVERDIKAVADDWAGEIYELNRRFHIFNWGGLEKFRGEVLDLLVQKRKLGENISDRDMRTRLRLRCTVERNDKSSSDESSREDTELIREQGRREGGQLTLVYLLQQRFGELPDAALDVVQSILSIDDLQACLNRLPKASTWESVLVNDQSVS